MEIVDYLRLLLRRLPVIVLLGLLCGAFGYISAAVQTPIYESSAQMFVAVRASSDSPAERMVGNTFTLQRMTSYTRIASSALVTEEVVDDLNLEVSPRELGNRITAVSPVDTVLLTVTVRDQLAANAAILANAVAEQLGRVIEDIERQDGGESLVKVTITAPATASSAPVSPSYPRSVVLGTLLGLLAGVVLVVAREVADRTVRGKETLEAIAPDAPMLAAITMDRHGGHAKDGLPMRLHEHDPRSEAYRQLRTNLKFLDVENPASSIIVTSATPNEGKTTTAINLALVMAQGGNRVCLVDADMRKPSLAPALGLPGSVGLTTVLVGRIGLNEALQSAGGTKVLACGAVPPNPSELLGTETMRAVIRELERQFDHVIIDMPPIGPVTDAAVLSPYVDGTILVVRSGKTSRDAVKGALEALNSVKARVLGTVLNMAKENAGYPYGYYSAYGDYASLDEPSSGGVRDRAKKLLSRGT